MNKTIQKLSVVEKQTLLDMLNTITLATETRDKDLLNYSLRKMNSIPTPTVIRMILELKSHWDQDPNVQSELEQLKHRLDDTLI